MRDTSMILKNTMYDLNKFFYITDNRKGRIFDLGRGSYIDRGEWKPAKDLLKNGWKIVYGLDRFDPKLADIVEFFRLSGVKLVFPEWREDAVIDLSLFEKDSDYIKQISHFPSTLFDWTIEGTDLTVEKWYDSVAKVEPARLRTLLAAMTDQSLARSDVEFMREIGYVDELSKIVNAFVSRELIPLDYKVFQIQTPRNLFLFDIELTRTERNGDYMVNVNYGVKLEDGYTEDSFEYVDKSREIDSAMIGRVVESVLRYMEHSWIDGFELKTIV